MDFIKNIKFAQFSEPMTQIPAMAQEPERPAAPPPAPSPVPPPPAPPQQSYTAPQSIEPPKKNNNLPKILAIIGIVAIVLIIGAVSALAMRIWDPLWNPFRPSPEKVISQMMAKMQEVKTSAMKIDGEFRMIDNNTNGGARISVALSGKGDNSDINNPKADLDFDIKLDPVGSDLSIFPSVSASGKFLMIGLTSYAKLDTLDAPIPDMDLTQILGKWIKADENTAKAIGEQGNDSASTNPEISKEFRDFILQNGIMSISKKLADENVNGVDCYHYYAILEKEKFKKVMNKAIELSSGAGANDFTNAMAGALVDEFLEKVGEVGMEIWVGKNDYMLYQARLDKMIEMSQFQKDLSGQIKAYINFENYDFNVPVEITEPEGATPLEDILVPFMGGQLLGASKNSKIETSLLEIPNIAETIFNLDDSYSSLCNRGLLNGYQETNGDNLIAINNEIIKEKGSKPACYASDDKFCISTKIADGGDYICVAKNGLGSVRCDSANTNCANVIE